MIGKRGKRERERERSFLEEEKEASPQRERERRERDLCAKKKYGNWREILFLFFNNLRKAAELS